ncbi:MAG TPA: hypothetical protein VIN05_11475 [Roseovarius sp.]
MKTRGTLMLVVGLLVASAAIRIGGDVGQAWARGADPSSEMPPQATATACKTDDDFHAMLKGFQRREARLKEQEEVLLDRQQALKLADRQIDSKLARLEAAEQKLRRTIVMADTAAESDVGRLIKVYETMKSKQAAALFEEMSPDFAAGFLARMRPEAAAGIMAGLSPQAAHTISVVLAGRNAGAPTE